MGTSKKWNAAEWSLFILTLTIPFTILLAFLVRYISDATQINIEQGEIIADYLKIVTGGILGILGTVIVYKHQGKNNNNQDSLDK